MILRADRLQTELSPPHEPEEIVQIADKLRSTAGFAKAGRS